MTSSSELTGFPPAVIDELGYYVYRLIDPRNGETFYIGKGQGNRVFQHARGELDQDSFEDDTDLDPKLRRIREIRHCPGPNVIHVIHRHKLSHETALEVEAALIDMCPGLTNRIGGHHSGDRGPRTASQIIELYSAAEAAIEHRALILNVGQSLHEHERPIDAARYAWKVSKERAETADVVLAVDKGVIRGVFVAERWLPATPENFPGFPEAESGRYGFEGTEAPADLKRRYIDKRLPEKFRSKPGAANPVRYSY